MQEKTDRQMDELQVYGQHAERHEKAYSAFNRTYILEHPMPTPPRWWQGLPWLMFPFGMIAVAGIALSALRTAPVFQNVALEFVGRTLATFEAVLAVIVIEFFVVLGRYAFVLLNAQDGQSNVLEVKRWTKAGFWTAFTIAVFANVYASVSHLPILASIKATADLIVALLVGISAPLLAFISADILATLWTRSEKRRAELKAEFEATLEAWRDARDRSWNARKTDYGVKIRVENPSILSLSGLSDQTDKTRQLPAASGFVRTPDGQRRVIDYLNEYPDDAAIPSRQLADKIALVTGVKIGHDTVNKG